MMNLTDRTFAAALGIERASLYTHWLFGYLFNSKKMSTDLQEYLFSKPGFKGEFENKMREFLGNSDFGNENFINEMYQRITTILHNFPQLAIDALELGLKNAYHSPSEEKKLINYKRDKVLFSLLRLAIAQGDFRLLQYLINTKGATPLVLAEGEYDANHPLYMLLAACLKDIDLYEEMKEIGMTGFDINNSSVVASSMRYIVSIVQAMVRELESNGYNDIEAAKSICEEVIDEINAEFQRASADDLKEKICAKIADEMRSYTEEQQEGDGYVYYNEEKQDQIENQTNVGVPKLYNFNVMARYFAIPTILLTTPVVASSLLFGSMAGIVAGTAMLFSGILCGKALYDNDLYVACAFQQCVQDIIYGNSSHVAAVEGKEGESVSLISV